jgi:radical SAM superfamily enzyme YgiQ (UPF0313 family)
MKDLRMLKERLNINMVEFVDDHFFTNKRRAFELLPEMKRIGISTYNIGIRADHIDDELFRNLVDCKCRSIYCGFESENRRVLEVLNKEITKEDIENALAVNAKYPIKISAQFILGIPTHTRKEIIKTVRYGLKLAKLYPNLTLTMVPYMPLPATKLYYEAIKEGYTPPRTIEEYRDFGTPSISKSNIPMSWLPWATKGDKETLKSVLPMSVYLVRTRPHPSEFWLIRAIKKPFFRIAYWRLYNLNFNCLIDYYIFNLVYTAMFNLARLLLRQPRLRKLITRFEVISAERA